MDFDNPEIKEATASTPLAADNSTRVPTTAFVKSFAGSENIVTVGTIETGVWQGGEVIVSESVSAADVEISVKNSENTNAASRAVLGATSGGASGGDPLWHLRVLGVTDVSGGIDNSDSDKYKEQFSDTIGISPFRVVTTAGAITQPLQPAFSAYRTTDVNNVTGDGTTYTVALNGTKYNIGGHFSTSTFKFTAPVTGIYRLISCVSLRSINSAMVDWFHLIETNVLDYQVGLWRFPRIANRYTTSGTIDIEMAASDTAWMTIEIRGSTKIADLSGEGSSNVTYFMGSLLN